MGLKYEEFAALPTNAGKLVHLTTAAGNVAKAFQNDHSNNQNKWLGADGILKIMPTKGYITEKGKTQIADYIKFDIDVAKLQRELEFTEHVNIYRKDFEKLPESLKRFLVFNDLLSTGWGSKNPGKSMIPYMSAAYSSKVNSMFSAINDPAVSNFTDDMAIMKEKLSHIMNFTGDTELDNRRIALVLQIGLNGPNATVTIDSKTGESRIKNKHNGGLFTVQTKKIGANPLNQVSEIVFDRQATASYREVDPSDTFPFQYGKGLPYFNQFPELSMLNTMEALTKVKHAENGTSVHEVSKGPKKKFLKIASHSRDHFGDTGVAYTKNEYAAKVLLKGQKIEDLSENMQEDLDLRFKVYEESVKRAAKINKEISKELDDTIYRLDHNNKEKSKKALDKKFEDVRNIYTNLRDVIDKSTVVIGKESYKLDSMAFDTLLRLAQHNFGNHIAEKQITDWEYAHGKKFVETVINEQHKKSKDISRLNLWMSPGDFGKTKPAIAYINKNIKMTHMKYTRNISLVAKEMNDKLDSLFKHKFGSDLAAKGIKAFMAYMPIGTMGYSEKLFENFYKSYTGLEKITDKEGVVSYRDRSNLELHPDLFNKGGKYGNTISLKKEGKKYKNLHESEKEYIKMYVKYTNFYKELIKAKDELEYLTRDAIDDSRIDEEEFLTELIDEIETDIVMLEEGVSEEEARGLFKKGGRVMYAEGEDVDAQMSMMMPEEEATHTMPDGTKMSGSTHAEYEQGMTPDEDMEDGYVDFIVSQSLSPEEETQLMNKLEADPELSVMFDKVLDKATEFAGSGPVEGPGSGVSDSIPARLSDGEFVLTAAATKQIGVDRLERMMEDAEMQAGAGRQQKQEGGEVEETKVDRFGKPVDKDIAEDEIKKGMMSTNPRLR